MNSSADPDWNTVGLDWPNRAVSRFVQAGGLRWHVQQFGQGPAMLLLHGTGASTHSWRDLAPRLARRYHVIAPDLPGHGFTRCRDADRLSLPGMAAAVRALLDVLGVEPVWAVGHSAGAAVLARMCLDGRLHPHRLVSLNGALLPLSGLRSPLFGPLARLFVSNPFVPKLFAWQASQPATFARMMEQTGSTLDARGLELYRRLASRSVHVEAALDMMVRWDVRPLEHELPRLAVPLTLVSGGRDRMIPPSHAEDVRRLLPAAQCVTLEDLGHLAHEEQPARVAALIEELCAD
jgi:magnesium chelatase accessory protein